MRSIKLLSSLLLCAATSIALFTNAYAAGGFDFCFNDDKSLALHSVSAVKISKSASKRSFEISGSSLCYGNVSLKGTIDNELDDECVEAARLITGAAARSQALNLPPPVLTIEAKKFKITNGSSCPPNVNAGSGCVASKTFTGVFTACTLSN